MLRIALASALWLSLAGAGCAAPPVTPNAPAADEPVRLAVGGETMADGHTVRFVEVVEDSRCPSGAQCVTAGVARIRVEVDRQSVVLTVPGGRMGDGDRSSARVSGLTVEVLGLEPYPDGSQDASPPNPVAVLRLS